MIIKIQLKVIPIKDFTDERKLNILRRFIPWRNNLLSWRFFAQTCDFYSASLFSLTFPLNLVISS